MDSCDAAAVCVPACVVSMASQFSTCATGLFTSPLSEWLDYFSSVIAAVEFTPTWKNAYQVKSAGIPDNGDY
jgi:hypothetical protein